GRGRIFDLVELRSGAAGEAGGAPGEDDAVALNRQVVRADVAGEDVDELARAGGEGDHARARGQVLQAAAQSFVEEVDAAAPRATVRVGERHLHQVGRTYCERAGGE